MSARGVRKDRLSYICVRSNPDVYEIIIPFPGGVSSATNYYLIQSKGEWLLIDAGMYSRVGKARLRTAFEELNVDVRHLPVALTHLHVDHKGLVKAVIARDTPVYVSRREHEHFRNTKCIYRAACDTTQRAVGEGMNENEARGLKKSTFMCSGRGVKCSNLKLIEPGDVLTCGSIHLQVVDTSGHSPGHIAFFEPASRLLFSGDAVLYHISPSVDLSIDRRDTYQAYIDNLTALERLQPFTLFPAHGDIREDGTDRIRILVEHRKDRLDEALSIIKEAKSPLSGMEVIEKMHWTSKRLLLEDVKAGQSYIIVREGIAVLDNLVMNGKVVRAKDKKGVNRYREGKEDV